MKKLFTVLLSFSFLSMVSIAEADAKPKPRRANSMPAKIAPKAQAARPAVRRTNSLPAKIDPVAQAGRRPLSRANSLNTTLQIQDSAKKWGMNPEQQKSFYKTYNQAPKAKQETDKVADEIAADFGGRVAKAPVKSVDRSVQKVMNDYGGDSTKIKDLARNTIIVDQKNIGPVTERLKAQGANVKQIDGSKDPLGYSGVNSNLATKSGKGEIQVNSPPMIYAKEQPALAKGLLGDKAHSDLAAKTGMEGGKGHEYYEKWRQMPAGPERSALEAESKAYYENIRNKAAQE